MIKQRFLTPMILCYSLILLSCSQNNSKTGNPDKAPNKRISKNDTFIVSKREEALQPIEEKLDVKFIIRSKL